MDQKDIVAGEIHVLGEDDDGVVVQVLFDIQAGRQLAGQRSFIVVVDHLKKGDQIAIPCARIGLLREGGVILFDIVKQTSPIAVLRPFCSVNACIGIALCPLQKVAVDLLRVIIETGIDAVDKEQRWCTEWRPDAGFFIEPVGERAAQQ